MTWARPPARTKVYEGANPGSPRAQSERSAETRFAAPVPKELPLRSKGYRRWVASLPCAHCRIEGLSNACHGDQGKGMGTKTCDSTCWPGCVTRYGRMGCHDIVGASGLFSKTQRRVLEKAYALATLARAEAEGQLPQGWKK